MEYNIVDKEYEYDDKELRTSVLFFPDRNIATVVQSGDEGEDLLTPRIITEGMDIEDIKRYFSAPQLKTKKGFSFNLKMLIRSIIYEAFIKEGTSMGAGNVRGFWYTHLKNIITMKLGLGETDSVLSTLNQAWGEMINSGLVTYEGLNIEGGKEIFRESHVKDSPFSNLIIAVEKESFFTKFKWIPCLFNCTLITAGGQPSRAVARGFVKQLKDFGTDMNQQFIMCVASDLDPAGYYIQEAFRKQLESAIQYYGGDGTVEIKRLFVRKDQVSDDLLRLQGVPCKDKARSKQAKKSEDTKWEYFCSQTDGGLYLPYEPGKPCIVDEILGVKMMRVLIEMDMFSEDVIEHAIIKELLKIIEETSDESKIMIPEIMRVFELMRDETIEEVYQEWCKKIIEPLIRRYLDDTDSWARDIRNRHSDELEEAEAVRDAQLDDINAEYDAEIDEKKQDCRDRELELHEERDSLKFQIFELIMQKRTIIYDIKSKCSDICEEIEELNEQRDDDIKPVKKEFKDAEKDLDAQRDYRRAKLQEFKEQHATVFNPLEMQLKFDIKNFLSPEEVTYYFTDLEIMEQFQKHLGRLLTFPEKLIEEGISCFEQDVPTFNEEDLLKKSSKLFAENIERVRNAFTKSFTNEMKDLFKTHVEDVEFELKGEVEKVDLTDEIEDAMEVTEQEIDEELWKDDNEESSE